MLDWRPAHSLRDTLPRMIAALKADPVGWYRDNGLNPARVAADGVQAQAGAGEGTAPAHDPAHGHDDMAQSMRRRAFPSCSGCTG